MYRKLKECGISNRDAANLLLNTSLSFDGKPLSDRINESSQLSRRIVHTTPGEIPMGLFNNFHIAVPQLEQHLLKRMAIHDFAGSDERAYEELLSRASTTWIDAMSEALRACNGDDSLYHNMAAYIRHADLPQERSRLALYLMLFVVTGCTGKAKTASTITIDYAASILGADFHTAQSVITAATPEVVDDIGLGLVRIVDDHIQAGSRLHVLDPTGTEVGLLPTAKHTVTDVGEDVSRRHALIWRENSQWYLRDLGSTNGTRLISGSTGEELVVGSDDNAAVQLAPTDIICLGASTRFIVMPMLGA